MNFFFKYIFGPHILFLVRNILIFRIRVTFIQEKQNLHDFFFFFFFNLLNGFIWNVCEKMTTVHKRQPLRFSTIRLLRKRERGGYSIFFS